MQDNNNTRELKVNDFLKARKHGQPTQSFPKILLQGKWLAEAGFKPGDQVDVIHLEAGELLIKRKEGSNGE